MIKKSIPAYKLIFVEKRKKTLTHLEKIPKHKRPLYVFKQFFKLVKVLKEGSYRNNFIFLLKDTLCGNKNSLVYTKKKEVYLKIISKHT